MRTNFNAMKTFLTILIVTFFITPVYAGEVDGKGLRCTLKNEEWGPAYFIFEGGHVSEVWVGDATPLKIKSTPPAEYVTTVNQIKWDRPALHYLDRKTLKLTYLTSTAKLISSCQIMTPKDIEAALQKQIEALKEAMKDNKL